ncbi:MAG: helicase associated domain-containing protein [Porticoccus sp.]
MYKDLNARLQETTETAWEEAYEHLAAYKAEKGNCLVPQFHITYDGFALGFWLLRLRCDRDDGILSEDQIKRLDTLEFVWEPHEPLWEKGFAALQAYLAEHGDSLVPENYVTEDEHYELGTWARAQRLTEGNYPREKYKRLCALNYVWDLQQYAWDRAFAALEAYKAENGDCLVPGDYMTEDELELGLWVSKQRTDLHYSFLEEDRMLKLDALGFAWAVQDDGTGITLHIPRKLN